MKTHIVNTHEAKTRLSELIREAADGVDVIVARNGHPVARIVPWHPTIPARKAGAWAGQVEFHHDIVGSDAEVVAQFERSAGQDLT